VQASFALALQAFPASIAIACGLSPVYGASSAALATFVELAFADSKVRMRDGGCAAENLVTDEDTQTTFGRDEKNTKDREQGGTHFQGSF
jgi:hypothetical protein